MSTPKLKILILSWELYPMYAGGLGPLARSVVDELRNQNAEVQVLVPHIPKNLDIPDCVNLEKKVKKYTKAFKPIPNFDWSMMSFKLPKNTKKIQWPKIFQPLAKKNGTNLYPKNTPLLTQAFAWAVKDYLKSNPDWDAVVGMDWMSIPAIHLLKQNWYEIPMGYYINSTEFERDPESFKGVTTYKDIMLLENEYFKKADFLFSVSDITKEIMVEKYDVPEEKIVTIFNDIPFDAHPTHYPELSKGRNVLFVGRVTPQKGLIFLLEAAKKTVEIDPQVKFIIAGDGEILPEMMEKVAEKELEKNVLFTGWANEEQKKLLYKSCHLFVMCSPHEPFGLTPLEAIRSDLPVISSNKCGFIGIIPSTPTFKYFDTDNFAHQIIHFLNDPKDRSELLQKQQDELSLHKWPKEVQKIIDTIDKFK